MGIEPHYRKLGTRSDWKIFFIAALPSTESVAHSTASWKVSCNRDISNNFHDSFACLPLKYTLFSGRFSYFCSNRHCFTKIAVIKVIRRLSPNYWYVKWQCLMVFFIQWKKKQKNARKSHRQYKGQWFAVWYKSRHDRFFFVNIIRHSWLTPYLSKYFVLKFNNEWCGY